MSAERGREHHCPVPPLRRCSHDHTRGRCLMKELDALRAVVGMVPHWYEAEFGLVPHTLSLGGESIKFFTHRRLTPQSSSLLESAGKELPALFEYAKRLPLGRAVEELQERFAIIWLSQVTGSVRWSRLIEYLEQVSQRTYENQRVTCNFVITVGEGTSDITSREVQKIIDPLATSLHTYIKIDHELKFLGYEQIKWGEVEETEKYKFNPEFLQPVASVLRGDDYSVHLTGKGDIVIMNKSGLLAAKRKGRWKLYDVFTFKNTLSSIADNYWVGCNIFEILFDLSFKRHGALLVYDPKKEVVKHVVNKGSIIWGEEATPDAARAMLLPSVERIVMGHRESKARAKRLFLELASMDGAVIFTAANVLAFGAMIATHPAASLEAGARSTAAVSSYNWGGVPFKISSDGEIAVYFKSTDAKGNTCFAKLEFL